jgi:hypothetical protein
MSGKYSGLQARNKILSPNAKYIPCSSHSLNLVGNAAAESSSVATLFKIYTLGFLHLLRDGMCLKVLSRRMLVL